MNTKIKIRTHKFQVDYQLHHSLKKKCIRSPLVKKGWSRTCLHPVSQLITSWSGVSEGRKRREGWDGTEGEGERLAGDGWGVGEGITLPNPPCEGLCSVHLAHSGWSQHVAGCRSPWGDTQAPASPPLSSVRLSASSSSNLPGGNSLPPSTFFLPPLPPGGAGEVVPKGAPRQGQPSIDVAA